MNCRRYQRWVMPAARIRFTTWTGRGGRVRSLGNPSFQDKTSPHIPAHHPAEDEEDERAGAADQQREAPVNHDFGKVVRARHQLKEAACSAGVEQ